jgi:hypothetical protein
MHVLLHGSFNKATKKQEKEIKEGPVDCLQKDDEHPLHNNK